MKLRSRIVVLISALTALAAAGSLSGQETTTQPRASVTLDSVEVLVEAGRTEEARAVLLAWWSDVLPRASRRDVQRGLWLRGRLTVDPAQAELDYRRLAVEYPGGPYSAQALFRLAQGAWASGDSAGAAEDVTHLDKEYPGSRVSADAEAWLAAAGAPPPPAPVTRNTSSSTGTGRGVGAPGAGATSGDTAGRASPAPSAARAAKPGEEAGSERYAVQLGAFSSDARARSLQRRARGAGFEARLVRLPGSGLIHVRVGRFDSARAADRMSKRLESLGFAVAVVPNANREEPIRE